jgi:hypothetical protein
LNQSSNFFTVSSIILVGHLGHVFFLILAI